VRVKAYQRELHPDRLYTLGIIGILPARKGLRRALEILRNLRAKDKRFRLEVFGHTPEDLPWVKNDPVEMTYFEGCAQYVRKHGLKDAVNFNGHVDIKKALADRRVGYVLSLSDSDYGFPGPESFHLAVNCFARFIRLAKCPTLLMN
jgi:glycosyltransferase involved in cell wall biosynthesis